ncbi:hypothetical protein CONPUDRAFT_100308 [Coniophora puteana RWD-64-598 SS2]|uniref:Uncharacterized protein n=1 Tax=Coniophora puteana (strain RWD-64-598) TaxID=741705 RepID=A0A5M3MZB7_CONPW|nr:uncharacterized protein CONPUDRAFT_100308 [Coniophora puteana RWD-64-598 SS2]EIW84337.1 hypothetical protein CONPUDRAFT_100308 [Coniophora puteana RWD-64-598 SS2]
MSAAVDNQNLAPHDIPGTQQKLNTAKEKKDQGDQAFKSGDVKAALRSYHETLMYLHGIDKNALKALSGGAAPAPVDAAASAKQEQEKTEADIMMEKIYANMSACHIKQENWPRAIDTADKALAKNEANYKAMFRKAKALGEQGFFEKAYKLLDDIKTKSSADAPMADAELNRLRAIDKEKQKVSDKKLRGFLSRDKKETSPAS